VNARPCAKVEVTEAEGWVTMATDMQQFNQQIIDEFRANEGRVAMFAGYPMVILHTLGAKTDQVRLIPLVLTVSGDERILFASFAGSKQHPAWVHNLRAQPRIKVELAEGLFEARIEECHPAEAARRVENQAKLSPQFKAYVEAAHPRQIPVFLIHLMTSAEGPIHA